MRQPAQCPVPVDGGGDCWKPPEPDGFADICTEHMEEIARRWFQDVPADVVECPYCGLLSIHRMRGREIYYCADPACARIVTDASLATMATAVAKKVGGSETSQLALIQRLTGNQFGVVYYLQFGSRVKIGTSTNLPARLLAIPHDRCIAIELGGYDVERRRHRQFAHTRVRGHSEWFHISGDLASHIDELRRQNGKPLATWARWQQERVGA